MTNHTLSHENTFPRLQAELTVISPSVGNIAMKAGEANPELRVQFTTFDQARKQVRGYGRTFIDGVLSGTFRVGGEEVDMRGFLDKVPQTQRDAEVIGDVHRVASLYDRTAAMVARNLKVYATPETESKVVPAKGMFLSRLRNGTPAAHQKIVEFAEGRRAEYPTDDTAYRGFDIDGMDILDYTAKLPKGVQPTIQVQRQEIGLFVMGFTDTRAFQKREHDDTEPKLKRRIYLNPDAEATPEIFEQLLTATNAEGMSLQLKMYQRSSEFAEAHKKGEGVMALRGDGIVMYAIPEEADRALSIAVAIAKQNVAAFKGRRISRIPQPVAEGIGVGDQPKFKDRRSLTTHIAEIYKHVVSATKQASNLDIDGRHKFFRQFLREVSAANGVNPDNPAFSYTHKNPV